MDMQTTIKALELEWDLEHGFLGGIREGNFKSERLERLISILEAVELSSSTKLEKRFVSLTWYIPIFLMWQKERYIEQGKDAIEIDQAFNRLEEILEKKLGIP